LRDIQGVTRVSLSKSDSQKFDSSSGSSSASEIDVRNALPCGTGTRPQFEIVMFFETVPAAVSAPPAASGDATAKPTPTPPATPSGTEATKTSTTTQEAK